MLFYFSLQCSEFACFIPLVENKADARLIYSNTCLLAARHNAIGSFTWTENLKEVTDRPLARRLLHIVKRWRLAFSETSSFHTEPVRIGCNSIWRSVFAAQSAVRERLDYWVRRLLHPAVQADYFVNLPAGSRWMGRGGCSRPAPPAVESNYCKRPPASSGPAAASLFWHLDRFQMRCCRRV